MAPADEYLARIDEVVYIASIPEEDGIDNLY